MLEINENIIVKFLSGRASEEEGQMILNWKNSSEENKKTFKEFEIAYNASEIVINADNYDESHAYKKVLLKLNKSRFASISQRRASLFIGYAATAVIAIGLTWFVQKSFFYKHESIELVETVYQSVETPAGAKSLVTLEDGTKIWLNAKSKLTYPSHFQNNKRIVQLEGEGYFDVAKEKTRPFEVKTTDIDIQVLGTVFNLKSYKEEGLIEATLIEGKIALNRSKGENQEQRIYTLRPNQQATFIKKEGLLMEDNLLAADIPLSEANRRLSEKLIINEDIDVSAIIAWKDGKMVFKNETFESIAIKLERRYNTNIEFQDEVAREYRFSGVFDEISIDQALKALQFTSNFNYNIGQDKIIIKK
ncbi:FecR family protein [Sunxiuqinia sp. A32]|uniref:FecR family protein n=1 Tax=Sunxiuqinia sp. A32 TaxID=3461496 RepID=UPI0040460C8B